jgi:hypothetical protein
MSQLLQDPEFCPKCNNREIEGTGKEGLITTTTGMRNEWGLLWKCRACNHEWVPPGWETGPESKGGTKGPS